MLRSRYNTPARAGPRGHVANTARSHMNHRVGLYAIAKTGPTQPTREARTGLPTVERRHFVSPGCRRAPYSILRRVRKHSVKRIGAQTEAGGAEMPGAVSQK